ncbi:MAG: UDP-N-acetylmuramoyl-L-alanyl-D-glutamate--2,6-diaminopimelate ligase [Halomonas sp.]|uniref:UDP-N-acetylmuramoyl-L-alanyl-D-glutamate--2, 6-diaminopimelate ligase n=1 Tax=Halomonas sp. TaxID=1486246 RepID=UPI003F905F8F
MTNELPLGVDSARLLDLLAQRWPEQHQLLLDAGLGDRLPERVSLHLDSRNVKGGDIFLAVPGVSADGRDYITAALQAGAALVLAEAPLSETQASGAPAANVIALDGLRAELGSLASQLYRVPETLELIGVTGTNGKSSVTHYIAALSEMLGEPAGLIGTLGTGRPQCLGSSDLTTPGALALQASLGQLAAEGVVRVAMEVSSHALAQDRLDAANIQVAVFTNLSRDHLDYHGSMAAYAAAKAQLFRRPELELAVVNADDPLVRLMLAGLPPGVRVLAVSSEEKKPLDDAITLGVASSALLPEGLEALVATPEGERLLTLPLLGRFNLSNVLLAMAVLYGRGASLDALFEAAAQLTPVPGRMQALAGQAVARPTVVIDYAHTPDALENALAALREHLPGSGRLWCVFGCGGDRDAGKRPLMAAAAECYADQLVITDDNPRSELPAHIRQQMVDGLSQQAQTSAWNIGGRREAILQAVSEAADEDVILIAGKGHEDYQEIAGVRHAFSDLAEAQAALEQRAKVKCARGGDA